MSPIQGIILCLVIIFKLSQADIYPSKYTPPATSYGVPIQAVEGPKQLIQKLPTVSTFSFEIPKENHDDAAPPKPISQIYGVPEVPTISHVYGVPEILKPKPIRPIVSSFSYEIPREVVVFHDIPAPPKPISQIYGIPEAPKPISQVYGIPEEPKPISHVYGVPEILKPKPIRPIVSSFSYEIPKEVVPTPPKPVSHVYGVPEVVKPKPEVVFDVPVTEAPKPVKISYTYGIPEVVKPKPIEIAYDVPIIEEPKPTISHVYGVPVTQAPPKPIQAYGFPVEEPKPVYGLPAIPRLYAPYP